MNDLILDHRQIGALQAAFRRGGWNASEIRRLCRSDALDQVRKVVLGQAEIRIFKDVIDLDAEPIVPRGIKLKEHRRCGAFEWDPKKIALYRSQAQLDGKWITCGDLCAEFRDKPVLNANMLDFLIKNPQFMPLLFRGVGHGLVYFLGTVYSDSSGRPFVRYIRLRGSKWNCSHQFLEYWAGGYSHVALAVDRRSYN